MPKYGAQQWPLSGDPPAGGRCLAGGARLGAWDGMSTTAIPPGPPYPRSLSTLGWALRPGPFLTRASQRSRCDCVPLGRHRQRRGRSHAQPGHNSAGIS
jgi:hypothetical protein